MKKLLMVLAVSTLTLNSFAQDGVIKIYDAKSKPGILILFSPGKLIMENGKKLRMFMPKDAIALNSNLEKIREYYKINFQRNSWDGKGSDIKASMNVNRWAIFDMLGTKQNAAWAETRFLFGNGKKKGLDNFARALDVIAHEYTHAVIQTTSNLKYEGQSGALNEHFADVFASLVNQHYNNPANPFLIGSSILNGEYAKKADALRDMLQPEKGLSPQPAHMNDLKKEKFVKYGAGCVPSKDNDKCGVHVLSGIPNKMAALVMKNVRPEISSQMFYNVMISLKENSQFADYSAALKVECKKYSSDTCDHVASALKTVGM